MRRRTQVFIGIGAVVILSMMIVSVLILQSQGSDDVEVTVDPVVVSSGAVYNMSTVHDIDWRDIHHSFERNYSRTATAELQLKIITIMLQKAEDIGEDPQELNDCLYSIAHIKDNADWNIPCYAERAYFQFYETPDGFKADEKYVMEHPEIDFGQIRNETCWIIVFNVRAKGDMGHIDIYWISTETNERLYYEGCD
ncbi:MAG: hypothetical protein ACMUHM_05835 [Thermoplasmatota archaeon]